MHRATYRSAGAWEQARRLVEVTMPGSLLEAALEAQPAATAEEAFRMLANQLGVDPAFVTPELIVDALGQPDYEGQLFSIVDSMEDNAPPPPPMRNQRQLRATPQTASSRFNNSAHLVASDAYIDRNQRSSQASVRPSLLSSSSSSSAAPTATCGAGGDCGTAAIVQTGHKRGRSPTNSGSTQARGAAGGGGGDDSRESTLEALEQAIEVCPQNKFNPLVLEALKGLGHNPEAIPATEFCKLLKDAKRALLNAKRQRTASPSSSPGGKGKERIGSPLSQRNSPAGQSQAGSQRVSPRTGNLSPLVPDDPTPRTTQSEKLAAMDALTGRRSRTQSPKNPQLDVDLDTDDLNAALGSLVGDFDVNKF
jgi:hypothetical protein